MPPVLYSVLCLLHQHLLTSLFSFRISNSSGLWISSTRIQGLSNHMTVGSSCQSFHLRCAARLLVTCTSLPSRYSVLETHVRDSMRPLVYESMLKWNSQTDHPLKLLSCQTVPVFQRFAEDEVFLTELGTILNPFRCSAETFVYQRGESGPDCDVGVQNSHTIIHNHESTCSKKLVHSLPSTS